MRGHRARTCDDDFDVLFREDAVLTARQHR
jgi:hypothetical protein